MKCSKCSREITKVPCIHCGTKINVAGLEKKVVPIIEVTKKAAFTPKTKKFGRK